MAPGQRRGSKSSSAGSTRACSPDQKFGLDEGFELKEDIDEDRGSVAWRRRRPEAADKRGQRRWIARGSKLSATACSPSRSPCSRSTWLCLSLVTSRSAGS